MALPYCLTLHSKTLYNVCMKQRQSTFRLTEEAQRLLSQMAQADGISHTAMLEIAIREAARKRGILAYPGIQAESQSGPTERH